MYDSTFTRLCTPYKQLIIKWLTVVLFVVQINRRNSEQASFASHDALHVSASVNTDTVFGINRGQDGCLEQWHSEYERRWFVKMPRFQVHPMVCFGHVTCECKNTCSWVTCTLMNTVDAAEVLMKANNLTFKLRILTALLFLKTGQAWPSVFAPSGWPCTKPAAAIWVEIVEDVQSQW